MESFSVRHMISAVPNNFPVRYAMNPVYMTRTGTQLRQFRFVVYSKRWEFQDFQGYAKPTRLLPASEVQICTAPSMEKMIDSLKMQSSDSLYKVRLQTSSMYGSGLTDLNAGVLLCLVDENGDSIFKRIPACLGENHSMQSQNNANPEVLHFQRGCADEFIFEGPSLGKITAVWISLETVVLSAPDLVKMLKDLRTLRSWLIDYIWKVPSQWRLADLSLTVIHHQQFGSAKSDEQLVQCVGSQYNFELEDVLLGEGSDVPMVELRPCSVTEFSKDDIGFLNVKASEQSTPASSSISSEESMKEYADLKFSLLFYDVLLILAGSSIDSFLGGENAGLAFLTGGVGGFLYLLFLQRAVDSLPAAELVSNSETQNSDQILGKFKGSASSLVLAFALAIIAAKYISGDIGKVLTPKEVISGMIGFLMCKVSVVLAAFKPMPTSLKQNK